MKIDIAGVAMKLFSCNRKPCPANMDELINVNNKLQFLFHTTGIDQLELPQIVVVGEQVKLS